MNGHVKTVSGRNVLSQLLSPSKPISYHDDPAFSSDPHVHPFFVTHTPWSLNPDDDPRLLQLPPLTMVSDDHSSTTHETNSSSNHTSTTLSTPPTSADSHSSPWAPSTSEKASHLRWPPEVQKKKKNIAMFWRRTPPETVLASVDLTRNVSPDPSPPPRSMTPTPQPPPERIAMAPEPIVSINLPPRSVTTPAAQLKPPPPSARRIAGLALRGSELDRIDELDESNPAGLPLHHNGPYEAAQKPATHDTVQHKVPHNIGSQYQIPAPQLKQDNKPDRKHEQNQVMIYSELELPMLTSHLAVA
ncbi:hypothetical protein C0991_009240 [Blastosporella zonata]|nr:hypothetical protein C0991_009240 [Blastosporella zonata]